MSEINDSTLSAEEEEIERLQKSIIKYQQHIENPKNAEQVPVVIAAITQFEERIRKLEARIESSKRRGAPSEGDEGEDSSKATPTVSPAATVPTPLSLAQKGKELEIRAGVTAQLKNRLIEAGYSDGKITRDSLVGSLETLYKEVLFDCGYGGMEDSFTPILLSLVPASDRVFMGAVREALMREDAEQKAFDRVIKVIRAHCHTPATLKEFSAKLSNVEQRENQSDKDYLAYCLGLSMNLSVLAQSAVHLEVLQGTLASSIVEGVAKASPEMMAELRKFILAPPSEIKGEHLILETINRIQAARALRSMARRPTREVCSRCGKPGHVASNCNVQIRSEPRDKETKPAAPQPQTPRKDHQGFPSVGKSPPVATQARPPVCSHCKKEGHTEARCWAKYPELKPSEPIVKHQRYTHVVGWDAFDKFKDDMEKVKVQDTRGKLFAKAGHILAPLSFVPDEQSAVTLIQEKVAEALFSDSIVRGEPITLSFITGLTSGPFDKVVDLTCTFASHTAALRAYVVPMSLKDDVLLSDEDRQKLGFITVNRAPTSKACHSTVATSGALKVLEQTQPGDKIILPVGDFSTIEPDLLEGGTRSYAPTDEFIQINTEDGRPLFSIGRYYNKDNCKDFDAVLAELRALHVRNASKSHPNRSLPAISIPRNPDIKNANLAWIKGGYPVPTQDRPHVETILNQYLQNGWVEEIHRSPEDPKPRDTVLLPAFLTKVKRPDGTVKHRLVIAGNHAKNAADPAAYYHQKPPAMNEIQQMLASSNIFAKTDIDSGYNNVRLEQDLPEGYLRFEFTIIGRIFRCLTMVQGFEHAPEIFQGLVERMDARIDLSSPDIQAHAPVYSTFFDDKFLGLSIDKDEESGLYDLGPYLSAWRKVMDVMNGDPYVILSPQKTFHLMPRVTVLGSEVGSGTLNVPGEKLLKIATLDMPTLGSELKSIRAFFNYFAPYAPNINADLGVLDNHINEKGKLSRLGPEYERICEAIRSIQARLQEAKPLRAYVPGHRFLAVVDTSDTAHGAVLAQIPPDVDITLEVIEREVKSWALFYWSKRMAIHERAFSAGHRELLGIFRFLKANELFLRGTALPIVVLCDNMPAVQGLQLEGGTKSNQIQRMLYYLQLFNVTFMWYPGTTNLGCADLLSRIVTNEQPPEPENFAKSILTLRGIAAIKRARAEPQRTGGDSATATPTTTEPVAADAPASPKKPFEAEPATVREWGAETNGGVLIFPSASELYSDKVEEGILFLPKQELRREISKMIHLDAGHRGSEACYHAMRAAGFWWPNHKDTFDAAKRECLSCLRNDVKRAGYHPPVLGLNHVSAMDRVHLDIGELHQDQKGFRYFILAKDVATGFTWAKALKGKDHTSIAEFITELFAYGPIQLLVMDGELESQVIKTAAQRTGAAIHHSTPYRPESNGTSERGVAILKNLLIKMCDDQPDLDWSDYVWLALHKINTAYTRKSGSTPFSLLFHRTPRPMRRYYSGELEHQDLTADEITKFEREQKEMEERFNLVIEPGLLERLRKYDKDSVARLAGKRKMASFEIGRPVFVNDEGILATGAPLRRGPYRIAGKYLQGYLLYEQMEGNPFPTLLMDERRGVPRRFATEHLVEAPEQVMADGSEAFYVEEIVDDRRTNTGAREFLVKWQGYPPSRNSWEPAASFNDRGAIVAYDRSKATRARARGNSKPKKKV